MTPARMLDVLMQHPFPGADVSLRSADNDNPHERLAISLPPDVTMLYYATGWWVLRDRTIPVAFPTFGNLDDGDKVHAEIRRVLAIVQAPYIPTLEELADEPPLEDALQDRLTDEIDRRKDVEAQLAQVTAERDAARAAPSQRLALLDDLLTRLGAKSGGALEALDRLDLTIETLRGDRDRLLISEDTLSKIAAALAIPALEPYDDALSMVKRLVDAHAVVSQRLVGAQKEAAERDATIEELRGALESIAANVGLVGSDQWAVGEIVVKVGELSHELDAAIDRSVKARQRRDADDALRSQIAVAVGLDDSASLALILDTVTRDRTDDPRAVNSLRALVSYHQAPIAFNARPLTLAERAAFVIRRLWQGRTNAANEAAALRRELSDVEAALGDLPDTAEREPIGDREEHLGLSIAERLRLQFAAR